MAQNEITKSLANRLEELTERKRDIDYRLSDKKQAEQIGIPYPTFVKYKGDKAECPISTIVKMAEYYDVSTDYLLGRTENRTTDTDKAGAADYLGISEKSVENIKHIGEEPIREIRNVVTEYNDKANCNLLFEYDNLSKIIKLFNLIELDQMWLDICKRSVVFNETEFLKNFPLDEECLHLSIPFRSTESYSDVMFKYIRKSIENIVSLRSVEFSLSFERIVDSLKDQIDVNEFRLNKVLIDLVNNIKANVPTKKEVKEAIAITNEEIREQLLQYKSDCEEYLTKNCKEKAGKNCERYQETEFEVKAINAFFEKYGENFKFIKESEE